MSAKLSLKSLALAAASTLAISGMAQPASAADPVNPMWRYHLTAETIAPFFKREDTAFWGDTKSFYNGVNPYSTDTSFWGTINPQAPLKDSQGNPIPGAMSYSTIAPFWTRLEIRWADIDEDWADRAEDHKSQARTVVDLQSMITTAESFWGAYFRTRFNTSYYDKVVAPILKQRGVDLSRPSSLNALDETSRERLFLQIYDTTMDYVPAPRVDYWMGMTHWTPALAQTQASVNASTVGLIAYTTADPIGGAPGWNGNAGDVTRSQGDTLASLIAARPVNGKAMGVSPYTTVTGYNPFVTDPTTGAISGDWDQIGSGIGFLSARGASIIDISVASPGYALSPSWANLVTDIDVLLANGTTLFVVAAGNDGRKQTVNVGMDALYAPSLIVVGSVGLDGVISKFSNRPGNVCLINEPICAPGDLLSRHFLVAPGELVLANTASGGVTRVSGTSYSASLVTGAAALIQSRWPWLTQFPDVTADILFKTATPLGKAAGSDRDWANYGYGLLNIQAAQSPLSYDNLIYYKSTTKNGVTTKVPQTVSQVVSTIKTGSQASFNSSGLFFSGIEPLLGTFRDFRIPLSSKLVGQSTDTSAAVSQPFQAFLTSGLSTWAKTHSFADETNGLLDGRSLGFAQSSAPAARFGDLDVRMKLAENTPADGYRQSAVGVKSEIALTTKGAALRFGYGDGAPVLDGMAGLGFGKDYDTQRSGANPLLALASGGEFMNLNADVAKGLAVSAGVTRRHDRRDFSQIGVNTPTESSGAYAYEAEAEHVGAALALSPRLVLRTSLTRLQEATGLLGLQSMDRGDLSKGSVSNGQSVGLDVALADDLLFTASGTWTTTTTRGQQALSIAGGGLQGFAAEAALAKANLFAQGDTLRVTVSQPMRVVSGALQYQDYGVVDRQTGALGVITQTVSAASPQHPVAVDLLYQRTLGRANIAFYGRAERGIVDYLNPQVSPTDITYVGGAKVKLAF